MLRIIALIVLAVASCSKSSTEHAADQPPAQAAPAATAAQHPRSSGKDPAAAKDLIAKGAVVLDVRTPEEFADGHLPNATNIPVHEVARRISEVDQLVGGDKTRPVVAYCASGARSARAKAALEAAGYTNVVNGGGFDDLQ